MNKSLRFIKHKLALLLAIAFATAAGGITTAVVLAAIPDSNGVIHGCRQNSNGSLKVIDNSTQTCATNETALNWNQSSTGGGGAPLYDSTGQLLGSLVSYGSGSFNSDISVFNQTLNRIVDIDFFSSADASTAYYTAGMTGYGPEFQSSDCTGQPYIYDGHHSPTTGGGNDIGIKAKLLRTGAATYGIVQDTTQTQIITVQSAYAYDTSTDTFNCVSTLDTTSFYAITPVSLPFNTPITIPFKFTP